MGKTGRLYSPEFKEEAVRLVHSSHERYPVAKIARDLDVSTETLRRWVNQAEIDAGEREGLTTEDRDPGVDYRYREETTARPYLTRCSAALARSRVAPWSSQRRNWALASCHWSRLIDR